jgi:hypothetical protein
MNIKFDRWVYFFDHETQKQEKIGMKTKWKNGMKMKLKFMKVKNLIQ